MKEILPILLTTLSFTVYGQQFSFQMFFTDAIGNKDTITLGYDLTATDSIDASFSEVNIISVPLDTSFDVRVTNEWYRRNNFGSPGTFHTKKQITFYNCTFTPFNLQTIDIYTKHWPVTVTWNNSLFNDTCRNGSVFTSVNPGGWWDTGSPSDLWRQVLLTNDSATFTSNNSGGFNNNYGYINSAGDTIPVFWQSFADSSLLSTGINELTTNKNSITIFPNPTSDFVTVGINKSFGEINRVEFYNSFGQVVLLSKQLNNIDIAELQSGLYFIKVTNNKGLTATTKLQKI